MDTLERLFGVRKPVIAMLHFPGLPGRPRFDPVGGTGRLVDSLGHDLEILQEVGVDGVLFCNEADLPYQLRVGPEIPAAMAAAIGQLKREIRVSFGVNILWDAIASLALARATGARFIREVLTGVYESDLGMIEPSIGEIAGYRAAIGAGDVALFDNIAPEFSSAIGYSAQDNDNTDGQAPDAFRVGKYALGNLLYYPAPNVMMGGELQWGRRENFSDGFQSDGFKVQFSFKYNFSMKFGG